MAFNDRLEELARSKGTRVCVGLDPDPSRYPAGFDDTVEDARTFLEAIIDATAAHAVAYKPNAAFFEAMGPEGVVMLREVIDHVHATTDALVIVDGKRGDIGNTAKAYARAAFEGLEADAVTVAPYMGRDSIAPFAEHPDKGVFVLCRTSNPGAQDLQDLLVRRTPTTLEDQPLFLAVAESVAEWDERGNLGLVTGATYPADVRRVRAAVGAGMPFLIPGVGAQGGDVDVAVRAAVDQSGGGVLINAGRSIMYAASDRSFAEAAEREAMRLKDAIQDAIHALS